MSKRPELELAKRPLQFIWICDCSSSMLGKKIESLNTAIREAIPAMQSTAVENPQADVKVRVLTFSDGAQWHISQPTQVADFKWSDLAADGVTDMGHAMDLVAEALDMRNMPDRGLPPVLVLVSDGQPTDDFKSGLKKLMAQPWGVKAVRIAIAIGEDADLDVLQDFIGNPEIKPLVATNSSDLVKKIKWASTMPLKSASQPTLSGNEKTPGVVPLPAPPADSPPISSDDIF